MNPKISVDYATLKSSLRNGLSAEGREYWWPILSNITEQKFCMRDYPDVAGSAERLLVMSCSVSPMVTLKKETTPEKKYLLLLEALASAKSAGDSPMLVSGFLQIISETITRFDVCHLICRDVVESTERRLSTRAGEYLCKLHVFKQIVKNFIPKTFAALESIEGLDNQFLNLMFMDFFKTLLPKETVLRIVDSYLLEGDKILYRYGLGLIMKYKKSIKEGQYRTAIHFWQSVQEDARSLEVFDIYGKNRNFFMTDKDGEKKGGREESKVGKSSGDSPRKSSADSPKREKNGSKNGVRTGLGSAGAYMTDGIHTVAFDGSRDIMKKSLKPLKISRGQIARLSEGFSTKQLPLRPPFFCPLAGGFSQLEVGDISFSDPEGGYMTIAQAVAKKSAILTDNTAVQVLAVCCPQLRCTDLLPSSSLNTFDQGLYLRFSTSEHGFSLSSLYASAAGISPLVLLIKPTKDGQTTIGAFISEPMKTPSRRIVGNGETFIFTLDSSRKIGRAKKYPWVKSKFRRASSDLYSVEGVDPTAAATAPLEGTVMQFAVFSPCSITFGASSEHCTNAIRMDSNLSRCHCGPSDTYGNGKYNILTGQVEGRRLEDSFQIESVELYCDRRSMGR